MATHRQPRMEEKNASSLIVVAGVKRSGHKHDIADRSNISYSMDVNPPWAWHVACFARAYYWEGKHRDLHPPPWKNKNASRVSHNKCGSEGRHSAIQCCLTYKQLDTHQTGTRWLVNIAWPNTNLPMRLVANPNWRFFLPSAASQRARRGVFSS